MFAIPSHVASDVVFTSKKSVLCLLLDICSANHYHRTVGCVFPLFPCFTFVYIRQRRGVLRVAMIFPKGVQLQLDEWPWNGEGALGALRCMGTQCWVER